MYHVACYMPTTTSIIMQSPYHWTALNGSPGTGVYALSCNQCCLGNTNTPHGHEEQASTAKGGCCGPGRRGAAGEEQRKGEHRSAKPGKQGSEDGEDGIEGYPCGVDDGV